MSSNSSNNSDDIGRKMRTRADIFSTDKPWLEPTSLSQLDPKDDEGWQLRHDKINSVAYSYIQGLKYRGMVNSGEIERDLQAYYNVTEPSTVREVLSKIYRDERTLTSTEVNEYNQRYVRYNEEEEKK
jgi:hypothetical protein